MDATRVKIIVDAIGNLTLNEVNLLKLELERRFGGAVLASKTTVTVKPNESTESYESDELYSVKLKDIGADKIKVIKVIKMVTNLGLIESKNLVDNVPSIIKSDLSLNEAMIIIQQLQEVGATVELIK